VFSQSRARVVGRSVLPLSIALLSACGDPPTTSSRRSNSAAVSRDLLAAAVVTVTNTDDSGPGSLRLGDHRRAGQLHYSLRRVDRRPKTIVVTSGFMPIAKSLNHRKAAPSLESQSAAI
jgi:hypothetical protein